MDLMRWNTPKGTIELSLENEQTAELPPVPVNQSSDAMPVAELLRDAIQHFQANRLQEAGAICQTILRLVPNHADTLHTLGVVYHQAGQNHNAVNLIEKALSINPNDFRYLNDVGEAYRALDNLARALQCYEKALAIKPDFLEACNNKGVTLYSLGKLEDSVKLFERTLELNKDYVLGMNNIAAALHDLGRNDEAIKYYEKALSLNPDSAEALHHLAVMSRPKIDDPLTTKIKTLREKKGINKEDAMHLNFALGRIHEDEKQYDEAFQYYQQGNHLKRQTIMFDINDYAINYVDAVIESYSYKFMKSFSRYGSDSERPVFIVGMPRSGTTLVEQILSSHPEIHGAGELPCFEQTEQLIPVLLNSTIPYPKCIRGFTSEIIKNLSNEYLAHLQTYSSESRYVTDKMPGNYQRIGLIKTLFPKARIIHCKRHPLDICVSIYCNYFKGTHNYAYDLTELGLFYRQYLRFMAYWQSLFPDDIHEVQYEQMTLKQEDISRKLIEFIGVDWNDSCLEFYNNKRPVQTASKMQVVKPMYRTSVEKWKRYENYLEPLINALGDAIPPSP